MLKNRNHTVKDFTCGELHSLAVTSNGELYSWGSGSYGQLGNNGRVNRNSPVRVQFSESLQIKKMVAGKHHSMVLTEEGYVYAFGADNQGQLGLRKKKKNVEVPTLVSYMTSRTVVDIGCGSFHSVVLIDPYHVFTTGFNKYGQLGLGHTNDRSVFSFVDRLRHRNVSAIFAGDNHSWFLLNHDEPYIDDYEMPEPWVFSQRSIEDDNDFTERRIGKKKKRRKGDTAFNNMQDRGNVNFPTHPSGKRKKETGSKRDLAKKKKKRKDRDFDMGDEGDLNKRKKKRKTSYFDDEEDLDQESDMFASNKDERQGNRMIADHTSDLEENQAEFEVRKQMNQGQFNDQDPEIQSEEKDFENELTYSEEELDQGSKEKLFDAGQMNMNERNFFPSKRGVGEKLAMRDLKDSKNLEESRLSLNRQSASRNMLGGPVRNEKEELTHGMKAVGGVPNQKHQDNFSMRPSESRDPIGSHNSSIARDGSSNLLMKKNPSGVRMDMRGTQNEKNSTSYMRRGQSNQNLAGNNLMDRRTQELQQDNLEEDDDLELLEDDSISDSGEELKQRMEFNQEQVYPPPNQGSKKSTKRRTVDNPQTITNDLNQMRINNRDSENAVYKRHQSQAANNARTGRRNRETPADSLNITRDLSEGDDLNSEENQINNLNERRFSEMSGKDSNSRRSKNFSKNRRSKIGSDYFEGSQVVEEEDEEGDSMEDFQDKQRNIINQGSNMDYRDSRNNTTQSQRITRDSQHNQSSGTRGDLHQLNHGNAQGMGRGNKDDRASQRGQLARGNDGIWGGNTNNQRGILGSDNQNPNNIYANERPSQRGATNDNIPQSHKGMAGGWGANPNTQIDQNYNHSRSIGGRSGVGNSMAMRGQPNNQQDMMLRDNQNLDRGNVNANSNQHRQNIVYNIHNTYNMGQQDPRNQRIADVNRNQDNFEHDSQDDVEDLMESQSRNEAGVDHGTQVNNQGGYGRDSSMQTGYGDKGRSTRTDNQDFSSGKEDVHRMRNLDEVHGIQKANTGMGMKNRDDKVYIRRKAESISENVRVQDQFDAIDLENNQYEEQDNERNNQNRDSAGNGFGISNNNGNSKSRKHNMLGNQKQQNQRNPNDPHNPNNIVWTGRGSGEDSEDNLIDEDDSVDDRGLDMNNVGELGDRQREEGTGLNVIQEEDDFVSSAQTHPRHSRQKIYDINDSKRRKRKTDDPYHHMKDQSRGRDKNIHKKRKNQEILEEVGEPKSELVFQTERERVQERVQIKRKRVLTCAVRVILTDNRRSHRFIVMRIEKSKDEFLRRMIGDYILRVNEEDPGMEYYNLSDFDNVYRPYDENNLQRAEDLGDQTSLTLMMIHNAKSYTVYNNERHETMTEEYRQVRSQLTTIGEMYIFTDDELASNEKWTIMSYWVGLFKEMFADHIQGMSVLELRPKELK